MRSGINKTCNRRGFTLVEMLVVIIIMAILMGMLLPTLMPLMGSKGLEASANKLRAVLLNARSQAAKRGTVVSVVFHMSTYEKGTSSPTDDVYKFSRNSEDCWYAVVEKPSGVDKRFATTIDYTESLNDNTTRGIKQIIDTDFNYNQIGPRFYLENGVGFLALADKFIVDKSGTVTTFNWYKFKNVEWTNKNGKDSYPDWLWGNAMVEDAVSGENTGVRCEHSADAEFASKCLPNAFMGNFRIDYNPDGSASFEYPKAYCTYNAPSTTINCKFDEGDGYQTIVLSKDGTVKSRKHYASHLVLRVYKATGLVEISKD